MRLISSLLLITAISFFLHGEEPEDPPLSLSVWEAIESTLLYQWNVEISREEVRLQAGVLQQTAGPFDPVLDTIYEHQYLDDLQILGFKSSKKGNRNVLDLAASKLTRYGTFAQVGMEIDQVHNPLFIPGRRNEAAVFFTIDQPLLRNFLFSQEYANELSASYDLRAVKAQFIFAMSQEVRDVVQQYWQTLSAKELLKIRQDSVERLQDLTDSVERLIEGGQLAETEINQQLAQLYDEKRRVSASVQTLFDSYNNLRLNMGLPKIPYCLEPPSLELEDFPKISDVEKPCSIECMLEVASQNRGDYLASLWNIESSSAQTQAARNAMLPRLDVNMGVTMRNQEIGSRAKSFFRPLDTSQPQRDWTIGATLSVPLWNDDAKGSFRSRRAFQQQALLSSEQLYEIIRTDIANAVRNHYALIEEIRNAEETVKWYRKAFEDETRRMKEGYSTLFIVLDFEVNLNNALTNRLGAYFNYASNLVELYFLTGQLVQEDSCNRRVYIADVQTVDPILKEYGRG